MQLKTILIPAILLLTIGSCKDAKKKATPEVAPLKETVKTFENKGHELVYNLIEKVGSYKKLREKKDVVYTYTYTTPDAKADISTEKYIFDGELSYGEYKQHQRTLPDLAGTMEQGYDGSDYWIKIEGKEVTDSTAIKRVMFSRPTNFYWFTMFQKLLDKNLKYEYLGEKEMNTKNFDIVKVSFDSEKPSDIYQLYINKETGLVDQFLFTVADFGVIEEPFLMQMEYEEIDGLLIPTKRKYKKSTWEAAVLDTPWTTVNWTNITFDNNLKKDVFSK